MPTSSNMINRWLVDSKPQRQTATVARITMGQWTRLRHSIVMYMRTHGITHYADLARHPFPVSANEVSRTAQGKGQPPTLMMASRFASGFGVPIEELLGPAEEEQPTTTDAPVTSLDTIYSVLRVIVNNQQELRRLLGEIRQALLPHDRQGGA